MDIHRVGRSHKTGLTVIGDNRKHEHNHDYLPLVNEIVDIT